MAYYDIDGDALNSAYDVNGDLLDAVYDVDGNLISGDPDPYIHGTSYAFSEMTMTDPNNVVTPSTKVKNALSGLAYTPTASGDATTPVEDYEQVTFACNIPTNGQNFGIWLYISPESAGCAYGRTVTHNGISRYQFKINNGSWYHIESKKAGWYYQLVRNSSDITITSIIFCALNNNNYTTASTIILDSVEVGFSMRKAHVMFNLDCVPPNFYDVGYPLFEQYGLKCTLNYHLSETSASVGATSEYYNASMHSELASKGFEFGVYSGWKEVENFGEVVPNYDDETKRSVFEAHAERMWYVNADSGIDAPTCVHGTGLFWGYIYEETCLDYNFMMIRQASGNELYSYFDPNTRTMIPRFIQGAYTADDAVVTNTINLINTAIKTKQALQIGFHAIKPSDYEPPTGGDMYMGVAAVDAILSYVKQKVDAGQLICCTTSEFVHEVAPDLYDAWNATKSHSTT